MSAAHVFFGGPDQPPRALRNLLEERVEAVPAGGRIDWMTYYFRDVALAEALVRAKRRGVSVTLCVDGKPRRRGANDAVLQVLSGSAGIGDGLRVVSSWLPGHLHTKLYCFSQPSPAALVGSFNPSGNEPENLAVVADIGDQDRGHNLLVEIDEPALVSAFVERVAAVHSGRSSLALRLSAPVPAGDHQAFFFPRFGSNALNEKLAQLGAGARLRIAASHFRDRRIARALARLVERGAAVEVLTHHTLRRTPERIVELLRSRGVTTYRYEHPQELPMHAKFVLAEEREQRWSAFGSYNLNETSRWLNHELLVFSTDASLWAALDERWNAILSEPWCRR